MLNFFGFSIKFNIIIILNTKPNFDELPKYALNRTAVSAVIRRFPFTISEILVCGTSKSFANRYCEIERGIRNSFKDRKSTRLNSSHVAISYAVFCLKKKKTKQKKRNADKHQ